MAPRTSDTRGEVQQQQVERDVDREIENKGMWARIFATILRDHTVQERVGNRMAEQARALSAGVDVRPGPVLRCSNYQACSHSELQAMVTEDVDPGVVGDMGELWIRAGDQMSRFQTDVFKAISSSAADWRGKSGDSARKFMADVGDWVGKAGTSAQLAGTQTQQYSTALANAKNSMPAPVDFNVDQANADLARTTDPFAYITKYSSYMARHEEQQKAHQEAVQVLGMYDGTLGGSSTMPAFAPPPAISGNTTSDDGRNPGDGRTPGEGNGRIPAVAVHRPPAATPGQVQETDPAAAAQLQVTQLLATPGLVLKGSRQAGQVDPATLEATTPEAATSAEATSAGAIRVEAVQVEAARVAPILGPVRVTAASGLHRVAAPGSAGVRPAMRVAVRVAAAVVASALVAAPADQDQDAQGQAGQEQAAAGWDQVAGLELVVSALNRRAAVARQAGETRLGWGRQAVLAPTAAKVARTTSTSDHPIWSNPTRTACSAATKPLRHQSSATELRRAGGACCWDLAVEKEAVYGVGGAGGWSQGAVACALP